MKCPSISSCAAIGDDPYLLAEISSALAKKCTYFPVLDSPRLHWPQVESPATRRRNALARMQVKTVVYAGLDPHVDTVLSRGIPSGQIVRIADGSQIDRALPGARKQAVFQWGKEHLALGLLRALRLNARIQFDGVSEAASVPSVSGHLVVCEEGDLHAQVVAANYAHALDAGLILIPAVERRLGEKLLERFYSATEVRDRPMGEVLEELRGELREMAGGVSQADYDSATFFTSRVPWGYAFPERPSTHIFLSPDVGICVLHGLLAEQATTPGIKVAAVVDPGQVLATEVDVAIKSLCGSGVFTKMLADRNASVRQVARTIELYPYDFLLISTHCGDDRGWRRTYEFKDRGGRQRTLVVDVAAGISWSDDSDRVEVMEHIRFVALDGVDITDPSAHSDHIGSVKLEFSELISRQELEPVHVETVRRVVGSAALKMADGSYICHPRSLANERTPIVFNNACVSWHELALAFTFAGARCYIGTLWSVRDSEAQVLGEKVLGPHFGKPLEVALWRSQNDIWGDDVARRPYVMIGTNFQRLRGTRNDGPLRVLSILKASKSEWQRRLDLITAPDDQQKSALGDYIRYLDDEIKGLTSRWIKRPPPKR